MTLERVSAGQRSANKRRIDCRAIAIALTATFAATSSRAMSNDQLEQLLRDQAKHIAEQDARIRVLEERLAANEPASASTPPPNSAATGQPTTVAITRPEPQAGQRAHAPVVTASPSGFSFGSVDGANQLRFHALLNVDGRYFAGSSVPQGADAWLIRQARPILEGTVSDIYDFRFTPDFGSGKTVIQDAFITARFRPDFQLTVGKFKVPFGLERLQHDPDTRFIERGLPNNLVPNRDIGVQIAGNLPVGGLSYAVAVQNGVSDGGSSNAAGDIDTNNQQDTTARLYAQPFLADPDSVFKGLGFGVAANYSASKGSTSHTLLPTYYSPGQQAVFRYRSGATPALLDGDRIRISPQLYYAYGPFGLLGEYVSVRANVNRNLTTGAASVRLEQRAWQLQASYFLTGEREAYTAPVPHSSVGSAGGRGAVEIVARYGLLDLDPRAFVGGTASLADPTASVRRESAWAIGVNWYLTPAVKTVLDFEQTLFDGGAVTGDRPNERAVFTRFELEF